LSRAVRILPVLLLTVRSRCAGMTAGLSRRWASVTNSRYVKALTLYREGGKRRNGVVVGRGGGMCSCVGVVGRGVRGRSL
jgi:hypothetical protein